MDGCISLENRLGLASLETEMACGLPWSPHTKSPSLTRGSQSIFTKEYAVETTIYARPQRVTSRGTKSVLPAAGIDNPGADQHNLMEVS